MNAQNEHMNDLAGAYVLDAVSEEESSLVEAHLRTCASCRREVAELREVVDVLPLALEPVDPAPDLKDRLLAAAQADVSDRRSPAFYSAKLPHPSDLPAADDRHQDEVGGVRPANVIPFNRLRRIPRVQAALGAAALAAVLALAIWNVSLQNKVHDQQTNLNALNAVTHAVASGAKLSDFRPQKVSSQNRAVFVQPANGSQAFVVAEGLSPQAGKVYQLWLINSGGPVSAGVFPVASNGVQIWHVSRSVHGFPIAAVTVEPGPSGSPRPTTNPLLITHLAG